MNDQVRFSTLEATVMYALESYIQGRADHVTEECVKEASEKIRKAIKEEVVKTVLQLHEFVSIREMGKELIISISDKRENK